MWRPWESDMHLPDENEPTDNLEDEDESAGSSTQQRKNLCVAEQNMVLDVFDGLSKKMNRYEAVKQTAILTKISCATVYRLIKTGSKSRKTRKDLGSSKKIQPHLLEPISETIYNMYAAKIMPNLNNIMAKLKEKHMVHDCSTKTLGRFLTKNGFKYKTVNKRQTIMESSRLIKWRNEYIEKILQYRSECREIYYLDETWFDSHETIDKAWTNGLSKCQIDVPHSKGKRICILHCGGQHGWVNDALLLSSKSIKDSSLDYHQDIEGTLFESWFENTLLPNLKANSVIVMDNASYHSRCIKKIPTKQSRKDEIQEFLIAEDLYFEDHYTKDQLIQVLHTKVVTKEHIVDKLATNNGHTVLRLPPYYCVLNPIELLWAQLKNHIRRNNTSPKDAQSVVELIKTEFKNISAQNWQL
ncbi:uncharacterized protein LOC126882532 [Diabrotica virgifera virgifera]|uniref:Tc1-like transposase DDE domain-containing protein n=1 Tax=Diabrotica virgifera virgifera TaxID=50390 RepID=A0ABM5JZT9_DIAVI|nr:uncharacterized protein LOC126882532 [Diabrotica virgifera virgifera]